MYKLTKTQITKHNNIVTAIKIYKGLTYQQAANIINDHIRQTKPQWLLEQFPFYLIDTNDKQHECRTIVEDKYYDYLYRIEKM